MGVGGKRTGGVGTVRDARGRETRGITLFELEPQQTMMLVIDVETVEASRAHVFPGCMNVYLNLKGIVPSQRERVDSIIARPPKTRSAKQVYNRNRFAPSGRRRFPRIKSPHSTSIPE